MRQVGACLVLVMLAGCSSSGPADNPEAVCRRQAYDDPTVKSLTVKNLGISMLAPDAEFDYSKALHDATQTCLRQKGVQVRGGVEPVRPQ
jgi:hypothetical protein